MVREGLIQRGESARLKRGTEVVHDSSISSLKHLKDDVKEVKAGFECGITLANFQDYKRGDMIECYTQERVS
jgi:translation initiation factor IF-2